MKTRAHEEHPGVASSIRIGFLASLPIGTLIVLSGSVGWFMGKPDAVSMVAIGAGLPTLMGGAKAWQAQAEAKTPATNDSNPGPSE